MYVGGHLSWLHLNQDLHRIWKYNLQHVCINCISPEVVFFSSDVSRHRFWCESALLQINWIEPDWLDLLLFNCQHWHLKHTTHKWNKNRGRGKQNTDIAAQCFSCCEFSWSIVEVCVCLSFLLFFCLANRLCVVSWFNGRMTTQSLFKYGKDVLSALCNYFFVAVRQP